MNLDHALRFAQSHHHAVLATRTRGGGIQQSPVLVGVDEQGHLTVSSRETAFKTRNLRRDPWAQLCIFPDGFFGQWVYVEGTADVVSLPEAMDPLVVYYRQVAGEHDNWEDYRASMIRERRVLVRIEPRKAGPNREG